MSFFDNFFSVVFKKNKNSFILLGDEVEVQNEHNDDSFWGNKYSSFGGYLLQALESEPSSIMG
jgi:hypothetical protein